MIYAKNGDIMLMDKYEAKILDVVPKVKSSQEVTEEFIKLTLCYEFNKKLAKGMDLGELGSIIQSALCEGKLISASLPVPIEGLTAEFLSEDKETYKARGIRAMSAKAKRPNKEDPNPTMVLEMHLAWNDDDDLFYFANHLSQSVEIVIDKEQKSLPGIN